MKHEEKIDFTDMITGVAEVYGKKISTKLLDIYWLALEKYEFEQIRLAIQQHLLNPDTGQFMPKPADFVRYVEGKSQEKILLAWQKLMKAVKQHGSYQSIIFDDPLIHYVVDEMGGWILFCRTEDSKLPFVFQEFSRYYAVCLSRPPEYCPKQLTGILEHQNGLYGHSVQPPIMFNGISKLDHSQSLFLDNQKEDQNS